MDLLFVSPVPLSIAGYGEKSVVNGISGSKKKLTARFARWTRINADK